MSPRHDTTLARDRTETMMMPLAHTNDAHTCASSSNTPRLPDPKPPDASQNTGDEASVRGLLRRPPSESEESPPRERRERFITSERKDRLLPSPPAAPDASITLRFFMGIFWTTRGKEDVDRGERRAKIQGNKGQ